MLSGAEAKTERSPRSKQAALFPTAGVFMDDTRTHELTTGQVSGVNLPPPDADQTARTLAYLGFVGRSPAFVESMRLIRRLATCDVPVLLCGETGTGKELSARAIHYLHVRRNGPFIPVNCGAIPEQIVESELFGHARGAFTDARDVQIGLVAQADGGTLFLDEVDSLSARAQITLLRFLQDGSFRPLGARQLLQSRARIVAATNADIETLIKGGQFRSDLYFRLSVVPVSLPPLRERPGDVRLLADSFLHSLTAQHGGGPRRIDEATMQRLERYGWPGNVRELGNVIQRAFLLSESACLAIEPGGLGDVDTADHGHGLEVSFHRARAQALLEFECRFVRQALAQSAGNVSLAAKRAGKERRSFGRLLKKHGINRADFEAAAS